MLLYAFERIKTIAYAYNSSILLVRDKRTAVEPVHRHDYYELVYVYEGDSVHIVNNVSYKVCAGDFIFLTPNDTHRFFTTAECSLINICFVQNATKSISDSTSFSNPFASTNTQGKLETESLLYLIEQELTLHDRQANKIAQLCLEWIIMIFKRFNSDLVRPDSLWSNLLVEISKHCDTITLEQAAEITGVSVSHFCRIFQRDFSMTFHAYLTIIRIRRAKQLLLDTNDPISSIAERIGYQNNPCRFYSNFKSIVGMTPNKFKKSFAENSSSGNDTYNSFIPEPNGSLPDSFLLKNINNDNK